MRNKSNLPYLITITLFIIGFSLFIFLSFLSGVHMLLFTVSAICLWGSIALGYTICPIGLIFQFLHKDKTVFDKWILGLNLTGVIFAITLLIFVLIAFPNDFIKITVGFRFFNSLPHGNVFINAKMIACDNSA